jgi:flagellar biosynthesis protein FliP
MSEIIEFIKTALAGRAIPPSIIILSFAGLVIYVIISEHVKQIYSKLRGHRTLERQVIVAQADLISANERARELQEILIKYINLANRQKAVIMYQNADIARLTAVIERDCLKSPRDRVGLEH